MKRFKHKTKSEIIEICKLYTGGSSANALSKQFNVGVRSINRILHNNGISAHYPKKSIDEIKLICRLYENGTKTKYLARKFNVVQSTIRQILYRSNVQIRRDDKTHAKKYDIDEHFFDIINSPEKAYFLGLLYADGYNNESKNTVAVQLKESDKQILIDLKKLIKTNRPLYYVVSNTSYGIAKCWKLVITNKHISQKLNELGCVQAKTFKLTFPEWLEENLYPHFIRGYFDGDGSIGIYRKTLHFSIVGTISFCNFLKQLFAGNFKVNCCISKRHKNRDNNIRQLEIQGNRQAIKIMNWLYDNATIKLERKYQKYISIFDMSIGKYRGEKLCSAAISTVGKP